MSLWGDTPPDDPEDGASVAARATPSSPRARPPKASFASRAFEAHARARARRHRDANDEPSDAREVSSGALVLWAPDGAERETSSMTVPATSAKRASERQLDVVRALHRTFCMSSTHAGCVLRDDGEGTSVVGACAFASAATASLGGETRDGGVLAVCAPNAVATWVETLEAHGVRGVESARSAVKAEEAFERVRSGEARACVLSHDAYRNVVRRAILVPWSMCFYDEVHRLKGENTKAHEAAQMLPKHVFRVGLSDQLFSNCDASDLWAVMNWVVPWRLGDRRLYEKYFVKAINDGHKNIHSDLAAQRTRELHKHLSTAMFPPVGEGALFHQYAPEIDGKDDSETTARKALDALASYEQVTPVEMAKRLLAMDRKARNALRCRVVASEVGSFSTVLEQWQRENEMANE